VSLRIAIVGCGKIADAHVEQIRAIGGAEIVALCDAEPLMARQLGARFGIDAQYGDMRTLLSRHQVDVVHITTPPGSHPDLALAAMEAGCHVFIEKPFALTAEGARRILDARRATNRKLSINYWYNFDHPGARLAQLVGEGVLGDPVHVESVLGYDLSGDFGAAVLGDPSHWVHRLPGKLFHNVLDHVVSKIALFMPDAEPRVSALDFRRRPASGDATVDALADELRFLVGGESVSGYGLVSAHARPVGHTLRVYGTRNTIWVNYEARTVTVEPRQNFPSALGRLPQAYDQAKQYRAAARRNVKQLLHADFQYFQGMRRLLALFYESIRSDGPPPIAYDDIMRISTIIDKVIGDLRQTAVANAQKVAT
jgi:predicted dehydrogenase